MLTFNNADNKALELNWDWDVIHFSLFGVFKSRYTVDQPHALGLKVRITGFGSVACVMREARQNGPLCP